MTDFRELQKEFMEKEGIAEERFNDVRKSLKVLSFTMDQKNENVVSRLDGTIVFPSRGYADTVRVGDVWFCTVERYTTVYYATPLIKITSSLLMGLSEEMRDDITEALYKSHASEYEKQFAQRYRDEVYRRAVSETNARNDELIAGLRSRISELEDQLERSRFVIDTRNSAEEDEIELSSEVPQTQAVPQVQVQAVPQVQVQQQEQLPPYASQCVCPAPGMPEVRMTADQPFVHNATVRYRVARLAAETIFSESFVDGKYFVHINPSRKFIVVKKHDYGSALCIDHKIRLDGLADYVPFEGRKELMAEYSKRYDGMIVRL